MLRGIPGPFGNWFFWESNRQSVFQGIEPAVGPHVTRKYIANFLSQKDPLQAVSMFLQLRARRYWCRRRKYYIWSAPLPTSDLSFSKPRLPYTCITGYTTTAMSFVNLWKDKSWRLLASIYREVLDNEALGSEFSNVLLYYILYQRESRHTKREESMTCRNDKSGVGPRRKHNTSPQFLDVMKEIGIKMQHTKNKNTIG